MTNFEIGQHRLLNQGIAESKFTSAADVVAWLGAVQAQDYPGTLWALGLRMQQATEATIEQAVIDRKIVRTWPMRGTLHFVAAADIRWMVKLLNPRINNTNSRQRQLELDEATFARSREVFTQALADGQPMTRADTQILLENNGISTAGQRGYHILGQLSKEGLLCFGPHQGKEPTFVLLDKWLPPTKALTHEEGLAELAKRYFTSHGPATLQDFVGWSGLKISDARAGMSAVKDDFVQEVVNGQTYWLPSVIANLPAPTSGVFLLPGFDEFILAYRDRSAVLSPENFQQVVPGGNGIFMPTIVSAGRVIGIWKRATKKDKIIITPTFFTTPTPDELAALEISAARYGQFMQKSVQIVRE